MIARSAGLILAFAVLTGSPTWAQPAPARIGDEVLR
jgi:hypothetical protein